MCCHHGVVQGTHASVSDFVNPAVFFAVFVVIGCIVEARRKRSVAEFAVWALIGIPGLYLGWVATLLHLPILWLPAMLLTSASFVYQFYLFKQDHRRKRARQENE